MPLIDRIDGPNRLIYLTAEASPVFDLQEVYREERALRRTDETLRRFHKFIVMRGREVKDAASGTFTERYLVMLRGTKFIPWDADSQISVTTTLIGEDGSPEGAGQFDRSAIASNVDIDYRPLQVELIESGCSCGPGSTPGVYGSSASLIGETSIMATPVRAASGAAQLT